MASAKRSRIENESEPTSMTDILSIVQEYNIDIRELIRPDQQPYERYPGKKKKKRLILSDFTGTSTRQNWTQLDPSAWEVPLGRTIVKLLDTAEHLRVGSKICRQAIVTAISLRQRTAYAENGEVKEAMPRDVNIARRILEVERGGVDNTITIRCRDNESVVYEYNGFRRVHKWREVTRASDPVSGGADTEHD